MYACLLALFFLGVACVVYSLPQYDMSTACDQLSGGVFTTLAAALKYFRLENKIQIFNTEFLSVYSIRWMIVQCQVQVFMENRTRVT